MPGKSWSRPLPRPIVIPDLRLTLSTLADVRMLIGRVPKARRETRTWLHVDKKLATAAAGGNVADAAIALRMAFMIENIEHELGSATPSGGKWHATQVIRGA